MGGRETYFFGLDPSRIRTDYFRMPAHTKVSQVLNHCTMGKFKAVEGVILEGMLYTPIELPKRKASYQASGA